MHPQDLESRPTGGDEPERRARVHMADGDHHLALPVAFAAQAWDLVAEIIAADWPRLFMKHFDLLREIYAGTPAEAFRDHPAARAVREMCFPVAPSVPELPPAVLPADRDQLVRLGSGPQALDALLAGLPAMIALRLRERWTTACEQADSLATLLEVAHRRDFDAVARRIPGIELQMGLTFLMVGDVPRTLRHLQRSHRNSDLDELGYAARDASGKIALVHAVRGDVVQARKWLAASDAATAAPLAMSTQIESSRNVARALIHVAAGDVDAASAVHHDLDGSLIEEEFWALRLHALARVRFLRGDVLGMRTLLEQRNRALPYARQPSPYMETILLTDAVDLNLALGAATRAHQLVSATDLSGAAIDVARSRVELYRCDPAAALAHADAALATPDPGPRIAVEASLLAAVAHHRLGNDAEGVSHLRMGLERADTSGYRLGVGTVPRTTLAAVAAEAGVSLPESPRALFADDLVVVELSDREQVVLARLADGLSLAAIAESEFVSVNTVKSQLRSAYRKLGVSTRDDAVRRGREYGMI